jgi:hypothetical protein
MSTFSCLCFSRVFRVFTHVAARLLHTSGVSNTFAFFSLRIGLTGIRPFSMEATHSTRRIHWQSTQLINRSVESKSSFGLIIFFRARPILALSGRTKDSREYKDAHNSIGRLRSSVVRVEGALDCMGSLKLPRTKASQGVASRSWMPERRYERPERLLRLSVVSNVTEGARDTSSTYVFGANDPRDSVRSNVQCHLERNG